LLKQEIGEAIRREFEVSEAGLITVNDVDVSGALHYAVVFISIFGNASVSPSWEPTQSPSGRMWPAMQIVSLCLIPSMMRSMILG